MAFVYRNNSPFEANSSGTKRRVVEDCPQACKLVILNFGCVVKRGELKAIIHDYQKGKYFSIYIICIIHRLMCVYYFFI